MLCASYFIIRAVSLVGSSIGPKYIHHIDSSLLLRDKENRNLPTEVAFLRLLVFPNFPVACISLPLSLCSPEHIVC